MFHLRQFSCKTKIISGSGAVGALEGLGAQRVFLVCDPYFAQNGTAARVASATRAPYTEIFSDVKPDPTVELAARATAKAKAFRPDLFVALGGGSAMDLCKAVAYFCQNGAPLAMIPTTSGSGSEVTDFAILTHDGVKHPLVDPSLRPDIAILDADLLSSMPPSLIADAGFDVLSHALEALAAVNATAFSDALAVHAFQTVFHLLPRSFRGEQDVRLAIHEAAAMAGLAFTHAGLGVCHALSHSLGGAFHVPHGRLNAILLPAVIRFNIPAHPKYAALARSCGIGGSSDTMALRGLCQGLTALRKELKLPATLRAAGIDPQALSREQTPILHAALQDPCCGTSPVKPEFHSLQAILREVTGHG